MNFENGGEQPANEAFVADQNAGQVAASDTATDQTDDQAPELDDDGNPFVAEETEELEWDGKKWVLPKDAVGTIKPALLRQADYTRKTQEVAERNRALEAREHELNAKGETQQAHFKAATRLAAIEDQLSQYADVKDGVIRPKYNWASEYQKAYAASGTDGGQALSNYHHHKAVYDQMMEDHRLASDELSVVDRKRRSDAEREYANRTEKAVADIAKHLQGWAPGNDLDRKVLEFGTSLGYSPQALSQLALQHPTLVRDLNELRVFREAAAKQKTQQTFEASQAAKPVQRVGGNGGSAARKTTDASGDALSTEEWAKRERERLSRRKA